MEWILMAVLGTMPMAGGPKAQAYAEFDERDSVTVIDLSAMAPPTDHVSTDDAPSTRDVSHHETPYASGPAPLEAFHPHLGQGMPCEPTACDDCPDPCASTRKFLQSDHEFDRFIGPITNPVFSKDPRSNTEARLIFINNWMPQNNALFPNGDFQVYAMQMRFALTDRLSIIAEKDGYAVIDPDGTDSQDGWLNLAGGLKYVLYRDVENQFLFTVGAQYEFSSGEANVFQSHGDGLLTPFLAVGKEFGKAHVLNTCGITFPWDSAKNSGYFYNSTHLDYAVLPWFYLVGECNLFHYTKGGNRGIPPAVGELDGLINLGTSGVTGNNIFSLATGFKIKPNNHFETGVAWETTVGRHDFLGNRVTADLIIRY